MAADLKQIRERFLSMSDDALLEVDPSELVPAARQCYEEEVAERGFGAQNEEEFAAPEPGEAVAEDEEEPEWIEEAAEVYSVADYPGANAGVAAETARRALRAAGIPCVVEHREIPEELLAPRPAGNEWRLLVPGHMNLQATSTLDRDIFNRNFEADWKAHLENFSDEELREMHPRVVFCGLFDRVERVTRAYEAELKRRGL